MSATIISAPHHFIIKQISIYLDSLLFVAGMIGNVLNVVVFSSLKIFGQSSCAFYLTIMSFFNIGNLLFTALPFVMKSIYGTDGTETSLLYCKLRVYIAVMCVTISSTCFCLATIDQYCATCSRPRLQRWCRVQLARRIVVCVIIFAILHPTPYLFLFYHTIPPITGETICTITNTIYIYYRSYVTVLVFFCLLPSSVSILFAVLAYRNLKQIPHYTTPLVRRELDKQLTTMVLNQVVVGSLATVPFTIMYFVQLQTIGINDPAVQAPIQLIYDLTYVMSFVYYSCPLYVYTCASERFRRQLLYVLFRNPCNRFKRPIVIPNNHIAPLP